MITVSLKNPIKNTIINQGKWALPLTDMTAKIGATYSWDPIDTKTTEKAQAELLNAADKLIDNNPKTITRHEAGIRPCTRDAQPFVGWHPDYQNIGILNGLGSKGSLIAPYAAQNLIDNWLQKTPIFEGISIKRLSAL